MFQIGNHSAKEGCTSVISWHYSFWKKNRLRVCVEESSCEPETYSSTKHASCNPNIEPLLNARKGNKISVKYPPLVKKAKIKILYRSSIQRKINISRKWLGETVMLFSLFVTRFTSYMRLKYRQWVYMCIRTWRLIFCVPITPQGHFLVMHGSTKTLMAAVRLSVYHQHDRRTP